MPICSVCHSRFDADEPACPQCGAPKPASVREQWECSPFSLFCIWVARILALLACVGCLVAAGTEVFAAGHRPTTLFEIEIGGLGFSLWRFLLDLLAAAACWGLFAALGFATRRAIREY